jgi:hypothetical protein
MAISMTVFNVGAVVGSLAIIWFVAYGLLTNAMWEDEEV